MNVVFDKDAYEKEHGIQSTADASESSKTTQADAPAGEPVRKALRDSLVSGKVGALSVDPNYLDFEALECNISVTFNFFLFTYCQLYLPDTSNTIDDDSGSDLGSFFQLSEVRLYTVFGIIAALLLVAIIQIICTVCRNRKTTRNQKVCVP